MHAMTTNRSGGGPDEHANGSWGNETLPLDIRKELLERELTKLGFRKAASQGGNYANEQGSGQRQCDSGSSHPQADASEGSGHAD